jgi:hypothetical protein
MASDPTLAVPEFVSQLSCHQQVQRISASNTFRSAPTLQQLFRFLAAKVLEEHSDEIKEYTIGVEALGRKQDFDPKIDPIVRVQVHRLRQKLKEYYDEEGSRDSVLVEIPKGHYLPRFEVISPPASDPLEPTASAPGLETAVEMESGGKKSRPWLSPHSAIMVGVTVLAIFAAGFWIGHEWQPRLRSQHIPDSSADSVKAFWAPFIKEDPSPIVAYADAIFLLDNSSDLFRFRHGASDNRGAPVDLHIARQFASDPALVAQAGPLYYDNGYTGTGELRAVAILTSLFTQMGARPTVESSYDITTNDLKEHNVILLGSPFQNVAVDQLPANGDFQFVNPDASRDLSNGRIFNLWKGKITNTHPQSNEKPEYQTERDPITQILKADYALISFQPGIVPGRHIVNLGGLDTKGTEGAALLVTSRAGVEGLSKQLSELSQKDKIPAFQALLRVNLEKGYQVLDTQLLSVHALEPDPVATAKHSTSQ